MPVYEYLCSRCNTRHEKLQKISDPPLQQCPDCQGPVKKALTAPAFRLKGAGWYETDFKTGPKKNLATNDSGSAEGSQSSKEAKSSKDLPKKTPEEVSSK